MCKQNHQRLLVEKEMRHLTIEWKGPFTIDEVRGMKNLRNDYGLYQIYGEHIIFGKDSLLYIGRTETTFRDRFFDQSYAHWKDWIQYDIKDGKDVSIYIARVRPGVFDDEFLNDAEALQIYWHSPPYNSANIYDYDRDKRLHPFEIVNEGERRKLVEWLSTKHLPWTPERLPWTDENRNC